MKVLLDTDIGSDIDDAICLAYLLAQPDCDLLGITTVSGEPIERAKLASVLCRAAEREIPIFPGIERPLYVPQRQPKAQQAVVLERWDHASEFVEFEAVEFLRQTIRAHPGEVTLLAIGPMTNIAVLFGADPEIPELLKEFVMMVGLFTPEICPREWNAMCDPHALAAVYESAVKSRSIGLDVTLQVKLDSAILAERFQNPVLRAVADMASAWWGNGSPVTFHDPLAAAILFDKGICSFERGTCSVDLAEGESQGTTSWISSEAGIHQIATQVDPDRFFAHFWETVL